MVDWLKDKTEKEFISFFFSLLETSLRDGSMKCRNIKHMRIGTTLMPHSEY